MRFVQQIHERRFSEMFTMVEPYSVLETRHQSHNEMRKEMLLGIAKGMLSTYPIRQTCVIRYYLSSSPLWAELWAKPKTI